MGPEASRGVGTIGRVIASSVYIYVVYRYLYRDRYGVAVSAASE